MYTARFIMTLDSGHIYIRNTVNTVVKALYDYYCLFKITVLFIKTSFK